MKCELCGQDKDDSLISGFPVYYGKELSSSTTESRSNGEITRTTTSKFRIIPQPARILVCTSHVIRMQVSRTLLALLFLSMLGGFFFMGIRNLLYVKNLFILLWGGLCFIFFWITGAAFMNISRDTIESELFQKTRRKSLLAVGFDAFFTSKEYRNLKNP